MIWTLAVGCIPTFRLFIMRVLNARRLWERVESIDVARKTVMSVERAKLIGKGDAFIIATRGWQRSSSW